MPDVIDQLRRYAEAAEAALPTATTAAALRPRGRRRVVLAAAAAVLTVGTIGGATVVLNDGAGDDRIDVATSFDPVPPTTTVSAEGGRWDGMPRAPITTRTSSAIVSAGDEMILWGGSGDEHFADGAAYSYAAGTWRRLAPAPLSARADSVVAWTGTEVLVVGGWDDGAGLLRDGAAYDPATDSWRSLPLADAGMASATTAAWTGTELVVVTGAGTRALDPVSGTWRMLPAPPTSSSGKAARARSVVWSGSELLVVRITDLEPVVIDRLDPATETWGTPIVTAVDGVNLDERGVVLAGGLLVLTVNGADGAVVDIATEAVTPLPGSDAYAYGSYAFPALTVGTRLVLVGRRWVDPIERVWRTTAEVPGDVREFPVGVAENGVAYLFGGSGCGAAASCSAYVAPEPAGLRWSPDG